MFAGMAHFLWFGISSLQRGFVRIANSGRGSTGSMWTQEQEGKVQVAQECKEYAAKRGQGLVPVTAADQSPSRYHHGSLVVTWLQQFKARDVNQITRHHR